MAASTAPVSTPWTWSGRNATAASCRPSKSIGLSTLTWLGRPGRTGRILVDGRIPKRHVGSGNLGPYRRHGGLRRCHGPFGAVPPNSRQAFDRWRRRQSFPCARAVTGIAWGGGAAVVGPGPRAHRRDPRQAGAIPGWRSNLTSEEVLVQLESVGCVIRAAGASLAPADRKLYALSDVTATVESVPLIASSIMSKKIAEGTSALVLDVKVGSGAFMTKATGPPNWLGPWSSSAGTAR